jgi:hypothetical protein
VLIRRLANSTLGEKHLANPPLSQESGGFGYIKALWRTFLTYIIKNGMLRIIKLIYGKNKQALF